MRANPAPSEPSLSAGRLRLTTEGVVWVGLALALGGLAWFKSLNLVLVLAYGMVVLLVLNGVLAWLQVRRVVVEAVPLPPVFAREETRVGVRVRNRSARSATVGVAGEGQEWALSRLPPGADVECSGLRTYPTRGRFAPEPPTVWSGYPFGLIRYERPGTPPAVGGGLAEVVVLPQAGTADAEGLRRWVLRQVGGEGRARKVLRRITSDQADVRGVRPYRPGDSIRWIHWKSSARRRELLVREYDSAPSPDLVLVVDPRLSAAPTDADRADLEQALSLAATIAQTWARAFGTQVRLVVAGPEPVTGTANGVNDEGLRRALTPLADLTGRPDPVPPPAALIGRGLGRSARVLVTPRGSTPLADAVGREAGWPFVVVDPRSRLPWYQPPAPPEGAA